MESTPILTRDIPQADSMDKIINTVKTVNRGRSSFQEIAEHLGVTDRQGRYYRRAAEILGFITKTSSLNVAAITPLGKQLVASDEDQGKQLLTNQVLSVSIIQSVLGMLAASNRSVNRTSLEQSMSRLVPNTTQGMVQRRLVTILSWLEYLDIVERKLNEVTLKDLPTSINKLEIYDPDVPVLPKLNQLKRFEEVPIKKISASNLIRFEVDRAKFDRANAVHEKLRSLLADKILSHGAVPTYNRYVDLAVNMDDEDFLIEVKTSRNVRSQVRRGVSQLYEYRYLQSLPDATLVLLLEKPLQGEHEWMLDYLTTDREIYVIWDNARNELFTTPKGVQKLPFMT